MAHIYRSDRARSGEFLFEVCPATSPCPHGGVPDMVGVTERDRLHGKYQWAKGTVMTPDRMLSEIRLLEADKASRAALVLAPPVSLGLEGRVV